MEDIGFGILFFAMAVSVLVMVLIFGYELYSDIRERHDRNR